MTHHPRLLLAVLVDEGDADAALEPLSTQPPQVVKAIQQHLRAANGDKAVAQPRLQHAALEEAALLGGTGLLHDKHTCTHR